MKQEITVNKIEDYEPQIGDTVTMFDGTKMEYTAGVAGPCSTARTMFLAYVRALGKVEREIPLPTLQGYRFSETGNAGDIRGALRWCGLNSEWLPAIVQPCPQCTDIYAVPLPTPEQDSNLEKQAVELRVMHVDTTTLVLSYPSAFLSAFSEGDQVEVRKVEK